MCATRSSHRVRSYFYDQPPGSRQSTAFPLRVNHGHLDAWALQDGKQTSQGRVPGTILREPICFVGSIALGFQVVGFLSALIFASAREFSSLFFYFSFSLPSPPVWDVIPLHHRSQDNVHVPWESRIVSTHHGYNSLEQYRRCNKRRLGKGDYITRAILTHLRNRKDQ